MKLLHILSSRTTMTIQTVSWAENKLIHKIQCDCTFHFSHLSSMRFGMEFLKYLIFSNAIDVYEKCLQLRDCDELISVGGGSIALTQFSSPAFFHCEIDEAFHSTYCPFYHLISFYFYLLDATRPTDFNNNLWRWIYCLNGPFFGIICMWRSNRVVKYRNIAKRNTHTRIQTHSINSIRLRNGT